MRDDVTASVDPSTVSAPGSIELLAPGSRLGDRYEIKRVIGTGGQAVVYLASDRDLRRDVALKVLRPDRSSEILEKRFRREAAIARDVAHPNVVRIFDIESAGTAIYLTMEHIEGEPLRARIERGPLAVGETVDIARQMFCGIDALHSIDIIHRDIKPGNVLLGNDGVARVADFGLARHVIAEETKATNTGAVLGTIDYLSPEQALGKEIGFRSDLYSAGVVMFEMLAGCLPFSAGSQIGVVLERLKAPAPDVRRFRPDCPAWLARIVGRLLEKEPEDRYASARDVIADIDRRRAQFRIKRPARAALVVAALAIGAAASFLWTHQPHFERLMAENGGLTAIDSQGRRLWSKPSLAADIEQSSALANIDGHRYVAIVPWNEQTVRRRSRHVLWLIDPESGRIARSIDLSVAPPFPAVTDTFVAQAITAVDLDHDGSDEIVITFSHIWGWASYIVLVEPKIGRARLLFTGSGHHRFGAAVDVDNDGRDEVIVAGINNVLGWYNALGAVKIDPPVDAGRQDPPNTGASPESWYGFESALRWYALLPRGPMIQRPDVAATPSGVRFRFPRGQVIRLGLDGLPAGGAPHRPRFEARDAAYRHLRESRRLFAAGSAGEAFSEIRSGIASARDSGDTLLVEAATRQYGRMLIGSGHETDGLAVLRNLAASSPNASEIMFDAAQSLHLRGHLEQAADLYIEGFGKGARPDQGKSKQDFIEGAVIALSGLGRYDKAIAAADMYGEAFPSDRYTSMLLREYVRWRAGRMPEAGAMPIPWNATDFKRICIQEMNLAAGANPAALLREFEPALDEQSEMRSASLSLHAQLLWSLGRHAEARSLISRALDLGNSERTRSTWAAAFYPLVVERYTHMTKGSASD